MEDEPTRTVISHNDKIAHDLDVTPAKSADGAPRRGRLIRLDRHIRQAEWTERLKGRF